MTNNKELYLQIQHNYPFFDMDYGGYKISIECGDGWLLLIGNMCIRLQSKINAMSGDYSDFRFTQVKEKFGELRVYTSYYVEDLQDIIDEYTEKSKTICELCGRPGIMRNRHGWFMVRCDKHWEIINEI